MSQGTGEDSHLEADFEDRMGGVGPESEYEEERLNEQSTADYEASHGREESDWLDEVIYQSWFEEE